mgnify:CR=1 FL=1
MPVFDSHIHIFPDKIAEKTVEHLADVSDVTPAYNGTRQGLIKCMQNSGIDGALNCPIATKPDQVESINDWAVKQNSWPLLSLGTIHPDTDDKGKVLEEVKGRGMQGIKMPPEYQSFKLDEGRVKPIWDICSRIGLTVLLHAGADVAFSAPFHTRPRDFRKLISEVPELKVVAAHFGGWQMWGEVEEELLGEDIYLETSFTLGQISDSMFKRMLNQHNADLLMFGSDGPWRHPGKDLRHLRELGLSDELESKLFWENAADLLQLNSPK